MVVEREVEMGAGGLQRGHSQLAELRVVIGPLHRSIGPASPKRPPKRRDGGRLRRLHCDGALLICCCLMRLVPQQALCFPIAPASVGGL